MGARLCEQARVQYNARGGKRPLAEPGLEEMVLTSFDLKHIRPLAACGSILVAAFFATGCGNSGTTSAPTPTSTPTVHTAASGTAITDKLFFSQLTLESTPVAKPDKNGLVFLHFKYADNDGKVYECVLPKAQSEGQYTLAEWSSTFAAYRLPKVFAVKKVKGNVDLGDYPFISPRPAQQPAVKDGQDLPQLPSATGIPDQPAPLAPSSPPQPGTGEPGGPPP